MKKMILFNNNAKPLYLIGCIMAVLCIVTSQQAVAQIQTPLKANADNIFVQPNGYAILDLLSNDEFGDCTRNAIQLTVTVNPSHGSIIPIPATNNIYYIPNSGFIGQDVFRYQIKCGTAVSDTIVSVNISEQPSNMLTDVCFVPRPTTVWNIKRQAMSNVAVHPLATPFVGDLDNDGKLEVVVPNSTAAGQPNYGNGSDSIIILNNALQLKNKFKVPLMSAYASMPLLIADVDNDGQGEIVIFAGWTNAAADRYRVLCYTQTGVLKWRSSVPVYTSNQMIASTALNTDICLVLAIADIDGDGKAEILAGDKIFAAENGNLLATLPAGGRAYRVLNRNAVAGNNFPVCMPALADLDGDGKLEVIAGNTTYKVNITNRNSTTNPVTVLASVSQPDGWVSVADIDGDGDLDVVVTTFTYSGANATGQSMYVWDGRTNQMIGTPQNTPMVDNFVGISRAFIGDIDGDGRPEIAFTTPLKMFAYKYVGPNFTKMWENVTTDASGATTMSMFDFDQNGEAELVYRDMTKLRILNKNGIDILPGGGIDCFSGTHSELPIVVDFDQDGHADILVSGTPTATTPSATGTRIMWFNSQTPGQWAPSRSIWNQHGFNPVYINDDLTVPTNPINPVTAFYEKGTSKVNHPFNNFLQQTTTLNEEGTPLYLGPDLYFDDRLTQRIYVDAGANKLVITIGINNQGNASYTGNLRISTYVYDTDTNPATEYLIGSNNETVNISINQQTSITYEILNYSSLMPAKYSNWEIRLNWQGNTYPIDMPECRYYNNITSNISIAQGEHVMCENDTERVYVSPQNTYWYKWYDDPVSNSPTHLVAEGDYYDVLKNASPEQRYYVEIWDLATKSTRIGAVRDTIRVFLSPDSLIWTGYANDMNWHNYKNWVNPNNLSGNPHANIPRKCTDVLIPDMISNYPNLTPITLSGTTDYSYYKRSECANIHFEHGGEVMRTDSLDYDLAYVNLTLNSNRWYMLSTPLQSMFPGDYYVNDPRPCDDDVFVYTRLYDKQNPETGKYVAGNWTGVFNNPDYSFPAGTGFSAWVDDKQPDTLIHTPKHFSFPKHDASYNMYTDDCYAYANVPLTRVNEHRFVYEPNLNTVTGLISLNASADYSGTQVIVGNPFMAHLDFNQFRTLNSPFIEPYYQVLDQNGSFITYYITGGTTTGGLTQYIAPMQSVFVRSRASFLELYTNARQTTTVPGSKLRSTEAEQAPQADLLSIKVSGQEVSNKALLYYHPDYIPEEFVNVPKAFLNNVTQPVTVYTLSENESLLDIQNLDELDKPIFLGIRTSLMGEMEFRMEGIHRFAPDYDIYLTDLGLPEPAQVNLRVYPYYTFNKQVPDLFVNNRFYLTFVRNTTDFHPPMLNPTTGIEVISRFGQINVLSVDGSLLKDVRVYDLQGRMIGFLKDIQSHQVEIPVNEGGVYIVRATNGNVSKVVKIYHKN